jgi:hypothetical protein
MKGSLGTSLVLHSMLAAWALFSYSAPAAFEVSAVDAIPVDMVPVESITQTQRGDDKAPKNEKPAPTPTTKPNIVENAENVGDRDVDLKTPPTPAKRPDTTETAAAPPKVEKPLPNPTNENNQVKEIAPEETAPKPVETAALPTPKPEVTPPTPKPDPQPEPKPAEQQAEEVPLPTSVPVPASRPRPEPPKPQEAKPADKPTEQTAEKPAEKTPDKKIADKKQETAKAAASQQSDFNADQIAAMLNKQESAGGGAKRSSEVASRGDKKTIGTGLSASEVDNVKGQIQGNWSLVAGLTSVDQVRVTIRVQLDPSGNIVGRPEISATGGPEGTRRAVESSTYRALMRSAPLKNMPVEKYDGEKGWNTLVLNFDPSEFAL